jgi:hypothetical protein
VLCALCCILLLLLLLLRMCSMLLLPLALRPLVLLLQRLLLLLLHSMHLQGLSCGARSLLWSLLLLWRWCCLVQVSRMHTLDSCWCMLPLVLI